MARGSPSKEASTDQQCDECDRWFHWRGHSEHEKNCNGEPDEENSQQDVFDPATGGGQTTTMSDTKTETKTDETPDECPECGGDSDIVESEKAVKLFRDAGELTGSRLDALLSYDYYHNDADCMAVFDA